MKPAHLLTHAASVARSPARQRLAELNTSLGAMAQRAQELGDALAAHEDAKRAEASAMTALQEFVTAELIEDPAQPDRTKRALRAHEVRQAKARVAATADQAGELNDLTVSRQNASAARDRIIRELIVEEGERLAAHYHHHAQIAEASRAATTELIRQLNYGMDDAPGAARLGEALKVAPETPEGALQVDRIKGAIAEYAAAWSGLPAMLAEDADATVALPEPLHEVAAAKLEQAA